MQLVEEIYDLVQVVHFMQKFVYIYLQQVLFNSKQVFLSTLAHHTTGSPVLKIKIQQQHLLCTIS